MGSGFISLHTGARELGSNADRVVVNGQGG
jgi:hypothetical protein